MSNKTTFAAATLVAAIPAGVLGFSLVNTFFNKLGQLPSSMFMWLYVVALAMCAAVVFLPFGIVIFGPKTPAEPKAKPEGKPLQDKLTESEMGEHETGEAGMGESAIDEFDHESAPKAISTGELDIVDEVESEAEIPAAHESSDEMDDLLDDDFSFDDEPPKKKKGK